MENSNYILEILGIDPKPLESISKEVFAELILEAQDVHEDSWDNEERCYKYTKGMAGSKACEEKGIANEVSYIVSYFCCYYWNESQSWAKEVLADKPKKTILEDETIPFRLEENIYYITDYSFLRDSELKMVRGKSLFGSVFSGVKVELLEKTQIEIEISEFRCKRVLDCKVKIEDKIYYTCLRFLSKNLPTKPLPDYNE